MTPVENLSRDRDAGTVLLARPSSVGMSVSVARLIAEWAHEGQLDRNGEPYIAHLGRVAADVPLFARAVAWLHHIEERSGVDEAMLIAAGASVDECCALRLLGRREGRPFDDVYLERVRVVALSDGHSGRIARAVKRADLLDHVMHRAACSDVWAPPYGRALTVLMRLAASSAAARRS